MASSQKVELSPTLNTYVRSKISKQEVNLTYGEYVQAIALQVTDENSYRGFVKKLLPRLAQYGYQPPGMMRQFRLMLVPDDKKDARELLRLAVYFIQLLLGDGSAGTPAPLPSSYWNNATPKAVDVFEDELLVPCWQHAANDKAPLNIRYASLRALAAAARASQTSSPDDHSIVMALLEAVRVALDQLHGVQQASFVLKKGKKRRAELSNAAERSGLQRAVFTAARTGLSRSSVSKMAPGCISGATSPDKVVARHALSLAAVVAFDRPQVCACYLETPLSLNIGLFKQFGSLSISEGQPVPFQFQVSAPESRPLNLQDMWARIYLARTCGGIVYSNAVRGDIDGVAASYWQTLVILACTDAADLVASEAARAMVGGMTTKSLVLRSVGSGNSRLHPRFLNDDQDVQRAALLSKAWRVFVLKGLENSPGQSVMAALQLDGTGEEKKEARTTDATRIQAMAMQVDPVLRRLVPKFTPTPQAPVVQKITQRLLKMLSTHAGLCTACRTVAVIAEARATAFEGSQSDDVLGSAPVCLAMDVLQERMLAIANESLPPSERVLALEALLWLQLPGRPIIVPPSTVMQMMLRNGFTIPENMCGSMADPWPADTLSVFLHALLRRLAVSPGLAGYIMECANCVAAVCPSRVHVEQLQLLWDTGLRHPNVQVKHAAFKGAMEMLLMQASPVTQPSSQPIAEVKAMAAEEQASIHILNRLAALWLGENTGDYPWASKPHALAVQPSTTCPLQEQVALGAARGNPIIVSVLTNLQLALLTCCWDVRVAAVQAITKIAARCVEPYRIQCYSILASLLGGEKNAQPSSLGVVGMVEPAILLLDQVYSTHAVLEQLALKIKGGTMVLLPDMAEAAQSRQEWLHDLVLRRVGFVQKELFTVGPNLSKLDESDNDDTDKESKDGEGKRAYDSDDSDAVFTPVTGSSTPQEPSSPTSLANAPGALMDILAQFTSKDKGKGDSSDDDDESVATTAVGLQRTASDNFGEQEAEELVHPATVLYNFTSNYDEEVSVYKGEKVSVKYELGDWVHVITSDGHQGLVPADYVQLEGEAEPLQKQHSVQWPFQVPEHDDAADTSTHDTNGGTSYDDFGQAASYRGESEDAGEMYKEEEDSAAPRFHWFRKSGSRDSRDGDAGTSWASVDRNKDNGWPYQDNREAAYGADYGTTYGKEEDGWTNDHWPSQTDNAWPNQPHAWASAPGDSPSSTPRVLEPALQYAHNTAPDWPTRTSATPASPPAYSATPEWPPPPSAAPSTLYPAESPRGVQGSSQTEARGLSPKLYGRTTSGTSSMTSSRSLTSSPSFHHPRRSVEDLPRNPTISSSSWNAATAAGSLSPTSSTAGALTRVANVMYAFQAEDEGEVSVQPGDKLMVMGEVDGWLQVVRESDNQVGLVPRDYVQM